MSSQLPANVRTFVDTDEFQCHSTLKWQCSQSPCNCNEAALHCKSSDTCDENNGCTQCENDYFKINSNYKCINCQDTFGCGCLHCADGIGCQQCESTNYIRKYHQTCGLYYCDKISLPVPAPTTIPFVIGMYIF